MNEVKWYLVSGDDSDVAVSTRIRLARNLTGYPFPSRLDADPAKRLLSTLKLVCEQHLNEKYELSFFLMDTMDDSTRLMLVERHVISPDFAKSTENRALMLSSDERISIMINEEDHLRIQVMGAGLDLEQAYSIADDIDSILSKHCDFSFDEQLGYLTSCPTNLGTGLRASVMLHLPALEGIGDIAALAKAISKIGLTLRGSYGEGSKPRAAMYQLSNQVTLGLSEADALKNLGAVAGQIISRERTVRDGIDRTALEDKVLRAYGILQNARILSSDEFFMLISSIRLGISMSIIEDITFGRIAELINMAGPACIVKSAGRPLDAAERDIMRAGIVRERLTEKTT